jgi:hypothetical protein
MWIVTESATFSYTDTEVVGAYGPYGSERDAQLIMESMIKIDEEGGITTPNKYEVVQLVMF